ncbi:signal peptide, CUB and EGF-like domain-containing protein 3 [Cyprinus carpio]|uniref:Signal peptide, CUB and EGF-like domain-containing protein 3 n=1 Tax=Cyprinus carpio TaxID=7962 RepID=A0A9Q9YVB4_CYPCA|nr:signal peptide, CUB and EGF-like domain-containing protein 3 [Cyprinus carpio]
MVHPSEAALCDAGSFLPFWHCCSCTFSCGHTGTGYQGSVRGCLCALSYRPLLQPGTSQPQGGYFIESCLPCPAGHHCASEGLDAPTGHCAAGFYCPIDFSSTTPHAFLCPKGHYCLLGSPLALLCPTGQYQPNPGLDNCIPCRPGYYCEEAIIGDPQPCPPHSYPPAATMVPQPCHNGTYTPPEVGGLLEERECLPCPPGKFCKYVHRSHEGASSTMGTYDLVDL